MADPLKRTCDELGVCLEEALFYLEGFRWDLGPAMEACRSKTLPSPSVWVESSPVNKKSASYVPSTPPLLTDSRRTSNQLLNPPEVPPQLNELIKAFYDVARGASLQQAIYYLERSNWNVDLAVGYFMDELRPTPSQMKSNRQGFSKVYPSKETSEAAMQDIPLRLVSPSQFQDYVKEVKTGSSSSSSMEADPKESFKEAGEEHNPEAIPLMASSQVKIQNIQEIANPTQIREEKLSLKMCDWLDRIRDTTGVSREEALFYLEGFNWKLDEAMEACRSKTLPPVKETSSPRVSVSEESTVAAAPMGINSCRSSDQLPSQLNNELMNRFCEAVGGATIEEAIHYLGIFNWDIQQAVGCFIDERSQLTSKQYITLEEMSLMQNICLSQSQFQASQGYLKEGEIGRSSSTINPDPTETGNVTVASRGTALAQVDDMAVEEDSSTETFHVPIAIEDRIIVGPRAARITNTIEIEIILADGGSGTSVKIPFRPDQTIGDIRNAIEELRPYNKIDYYLMALTGEEYRDLNISVYRISDGRSTTLHQLYSID